MASTEPLIIKGIARSIGRARIETLLRSITARSTGVSPDQLVGRGLKRQRASLWITPAAYRPINWSGAD